MKQVSVTYTDGSTQRLAVDRLKQAEEEIRQTVTGCDFAVMVDSVDIDGEEYGCDWRLTLQPLRATDQALPEPDETAPVEWLIVTPQGNRSLSVNRLYGTRALLRMALVEKMKAYLQQISEADEADFDKVMRLLRRHTDAVIDEIEKDWTEERMCPDPEWFGDAEELEETDDDGADHATE